MMPAKKIFALACLTLTGLILAACSGIPGGNNGGGGGGTPGKATFTIGGTVTGLAGTGLVLVDNGTDMVTITGTGTASHVVGHQKWATGGLVDSSNVVGGTRWVNNENAGSGEGWSMGWGVIWNTVSDVGVMAPPGGMNWAICTSPLNNAVTRCSGSRMIWNTSSSGLSSATSGLVGSFSSTR